jgi:copper oxidase (laccase) domain-containing protein
MERIWSIRKSLPGKPMSGGHHIDLFEANRWLLEQAGIPGTSIQISGIDTYTAPDFFSARREGLGTGRNINAIKLI